MQSKKKEERYPFILSIYNLIIFNFSHLNNNIYLLPVEVDDNDPCDFFLNTSIFFVREDKVIKI